MTDYFALLNFPRSPWLDAETVRARFLELSAPLHPDRVHGQPEAPAANTRFAELNTASTILAEPRDRLKHLLDLEAAPAAAAAQSIPADFIEVYSRIGQTGRDVDRFLAERARATSPVLQAQLFATGLEWNDRIAELQITVAAARQNAEVELKTLAARWPDHKPLARLRELAHAFAMIQRWDSQLRERYAALAAFG